jgi:hypothetical protein
MKKRNIAWLAAILVVGPVVGISPPPVVGAS